MLALLGRLLALAATAASLRLLLLPLAPPLTPLLLLLLVCCFNGAASFDSCFRALYCLQYRLPRQAIFSIPITLIPTAATILFTFPCRFGCRDSIRFLLTALLFLL